MGARRRGSSRSSVRRRPVVRVLLMLLLLVVVWYVSGDRFGPCDACFTLGAIGGGTPPAKVLMLLVGVLWFGVPTTFYDLVAGDLLRFNQRGKLVVSTNELD